MIHKAVSYYIKLKGFQITGPRLVYFSYNKCPTVVTNSVILYGFPFGVSDFLDLNLSSSTSFVIKNLFDTSFSYYTLNRKK